MSWRTIRNCGKVKTFHKKIPLKTGKIKTGELLDEVAQEFAKVSTQVFDTIGDFVFSYGERQLSSIFLPAFYNLGFGAMQEVPTRRKELGESCSAGWLDYWVQKEDRWVYLIEAKHSWQLFEGSVTQDAHAKINASVEQLNRINGEELENLSFVDSTYKISMVVLPIYRNLLKGVAAQEGDECPVSAADMDRFVGAAARSLPSCVSWVGAWVLPDRMQYAFSGNSFSGLRTFPGVLFLVSVVAD
ncbi:hypothetical protein [Halomonas chromatireducens]|uniref:Uncharacterized protein n=1 Tax=Halomonas chromatireducens TaxID=507626 RepID=A0A120JVY2_9GAMM|nr:hypothetical protein [Halomonas chromatireducens]AMD00624.1 hypothetical protein LOKO_01556 [Halomonas chromatireducens]